MFVKQTLENEHPQREDDLFTLIPVDTVSCLDAHFSVLQTNCKGMGVPHTAIFINSIITTTAWSFLIVKLCFVSKLFVWVSVSAFLGSLCPELPVQVTVCVQGTAQPLLHPGQGENSSRPRFQGVVDAGLVG